MNSRRQYLATLAGATTIGLAGCLGDDVEETQRATLEDNEFNPKNARIREEEAPFVWENNDDHSHVIKSASPNWDFEQEVGAGELLSNEFRRDGVFYVVCAEHGDAEEFTGMRMKIEIGTHEIEEPVE